MARNSILLDKSLLFAARIVKLHKFLIKENTRPSSQSKSCAVPHPSALTPMKPSMASVKPILSPNCRSH